LFQRLQHLVAYSCLDHARVSDDDRALAAQAPNLALQAAQRPRAMMHHLSGSELADLFCHDSSPLI